jgi:hypothetical protein
MVFDATGSQRTELSGVKRRPLARQGQAERQLPRTLVPFDEVRNEGGQLAALKVAASAKLQGNDH